MSARIVIAGGGFGGLYAVQALQRKLPEGSAEITVVSESNFLLYAPLLPAVAGGALSPRHVTIPLRKHLNGAKLAIGRVSGCDLDRRTLAFGVLVDAFVVRMTLVPAVLALLGKRAWWLPAWLDRKLPNLDIEGEKLMHDLEPPAQPAEQPPPTPVAH